MTVSWWPLLAVVAGVLALVAALVDGRARSPRPSRAQRRAARARAARPADAPPDPAPGVAAEPWDRPEDERDPVGNDRDPIGEDRPTTEDDQHPTEDNSGHGHPADGDTRGHRPDGRG